MSEVEHLTQEKILLAALALFSEQGIKKTSLDEVAYRAGVTRITVYRHFGNKRALAYEVFMHIEQIFQKGLADLEGDPDAWENVLDQIGERLSALPRGDASARTDELKRLYPEVYASIQEVRVATLNGIFDHFISRAERKGLLREGLNRPIVQAIFWELVINFFDNPRLSSHGLSDVALYQVMKNILLYGILKSEPPVAHEPQTRPGSETPNETSI